jgi:hypothetical protein
MFLEKRSGDWSSLNTKTATAYCDAEIRGRIRLLKQKLAARYRAAESMPRETTMTLLTNMTMKKNVGRERAFAKLAAPYLRNGCSLDIRELKGRHPYAVFSRLKPREDIRVDAFFPQNGIVVEYVVLGCLPRADGPEGVYGYGLWTIEVPDHALGRLLHRDPRADVVACIMQAHKAALLIDVEAALPYVNEDRRFLLPAGRGAFIGELVGGPDVSANHEIIIHVRAHTWVHESELHDDQRSTWFLPAGESGRRMCDSVLLPWPLRPLFPPFATSAIA